MTPAAKQPRSSSAGRGHASRARRRLNDQDKQSGVRRLQARILDIERRLRQARALRPHARAKLEEELLAARRLLARWDDTH